ncbi:hypothetical protein HX109_08620 [Galbibacter sp. BG1]|uniref:hypothetical protein n=1 Tax=Galbibacter sp. BG1 TaxID=1170699 RepID=UPI0015B8317E|nr:hypothetical protein [Galbibacter sp. BG1]QLE01627.1 hypothetical protein HX109_08620 [Galbibacter sp. BG1]
MDTEKLRTIHVQFISWLETKRNQYVIDEYINYVRDKLLVYERYSKDQDKSILNSEIPRSISRYLDEFYVDFDFIREARVYFDQMNKVWEESLHRQSERGLKSNKFIR